MGFNAKISILCSSEIRVSGAVGNVASARKSGSYPRGRGNVRARFLIFNLHTFAYL